MFTNLQNANIKVNSWLHKESRMCVFSKKGMKMKLHFIKKKGGGSKSDLQVAISGWENRVVGTESDRVLWIVDPKG